MIRRSLLAAAAAIALAAPASAQWTVVDPAHIAQSVANTARQIAEAQRQYQQLVSTYQAISGARGVSGLGNLGGSYLPGNIPGLLSGNGTFGGAANWLGQNRAHAPSSDAWGQEMQRRETVTANAQALAERQMADIGDRFAKLGSLQARLEAATDLQEVATIQAAIGLERQHLEAHRAAIEQVRLMLAADDRVTAQRQEQMIRQDYRGEAERTRTGLAGW